MTRLRFFPLPLLLLLAASVTAQPVTYHLKGFMGVQGGESFTYQLELKDSTGNLLSGYASTYLKAANDVKAKVIAEVNRADKTLAIREVSIIQNNYFRSRAIICLVEALLTYNTAEHSLSGPLITKTAGNGANCSAGSITFTSAGELDHLFAPPAAEAPNEKPAAKPAPPARKPVRVIYDTARPPAVVKQTPAAKQPDNITEGRDKSYYWESGDIVLELWDGNNIDNDQVTVLFNGNEVLKHYRLTKEKKRLVFPVGGNELNIITIVADNEGADPPNTANLILHDGDKTYDVVAHNTIGKKALIKIRKK